MKSLNVSTTKPIFGLGVLTDIIGPGEPDEDGVIYDSCYRFRLDDGSVWSLPATWRFNAYAPAGNGTYEQIWPVKKTKSGKETSEITVGMTVLFTRYWAFDSDGEPLWSRNSDGSVRTDANGNPYHATYTDVRCAEPEFLDAALAHRRYLIDTARERWSAYTETRNNLESEVAF